MAVNKKEVISQVREIINLIETASLSGPDPDRVAFGRRRLGQEALQQIGDSILRSGPSGIGWIKPDYAKTRFAEAGIVDIEFPAGTEQVTPKRMGGKIVLEDDTVFVEVVIECHVKNVEYKPKMQWVDIDPDTRKRVPVLDADRNPVVKETNVNYEMVPVSARLPIPIRLIVDIMNEIGRPSLLEEPDPKYVPAPLGMALASLLPGPVMAQLMPPMRHVNRRGDYGDSEYYDWVRDPGFPPPAMMMMMDHMMDRRPAIPCRVFLQPHPDGRTEIVAEPYTKQELRDNQDEIRNKKDWSCWDITRTEAYLAFRTARLEAPVNDDVKTA